MPYVYDPHTQKKDEDDEGMNTQISSGGGGPSGAGTQTSSTDGQPSQPQQVGGQAGRPNTGSQFQTLDSYLNINQPQASHMGQQVTGGVQQKISGANQAIQEAGQDYKDLVDNKSQAPSNQDIDDAIAAGRPTSLGGTGEGNLSDATGWTQLEYQGPRSIADTPGMAAQANAQASQAGAEAHALQSASGRDAILEQYFGRPNYTQGQRSLDQALISSSPGFGADVLSTSAQASGLAGQQSGTLQDSQGYSQQAATNMQLARDYARKALGIDEFGQVIQPKEGTEAGALGQAYSSIMDRVGTQQQDIDSLYDRIQSGNYTPEDLAHFGITEDQIPFLRGMNLNQFITEVPTLSQKNVMSEDEQNYLRNLAKMAGIEDVFAYEDLSPLDSPLGWDQDRFQGEYGQNVQRLQQAQNDLNIYNTYLNNIQQHIKNLEQKQFSTDPQQWQSQMSNLNNYRNFYLQKINELKETLGEESGSIIPRDIGGRI